MKPLTLTMTAFGSFAHETTVHFDRLEKGLFLVVGDTGAGKTTIFDAIVFALFGVASGSSRKPGMMHSDYVEKSRDTVVTMSFEHQGRTYTVERTIHFRKKRGSENNYDDGNVSATLYLPDDAPIDGATRVTNRCEALLGLNAEQFRKIVMLAQGEFRQFLAADAEKKSEILGKLFDSSGYIRFQNLLIQSRDALKLQRRGYWQQVETQMNTVFRLPEDAESAYLYDPTNAELPENLSSLVDTDLEQAAIIEKEKERLQRQVNALNTAKGAAEGNNKLLEELDRAREHAKALVQQRQEMEGRELAYQLAEKALHRCLPPQEKWDSARARREQTEGEISALEQSVTALERACRDRQEELEANQTLNEQIDSIKREREKLSESLVKYSELDEKRRSLTETGEQAAKIRKRLEERQKERQEGQQQLAECLQELSGLEDAGTQELQQRTLMERAEQAAKAFDVLETQVHTLQDKEEELVQEEQTLSTLTADSVAAEEQHHRLYQRFLSAQAGLLASGLEKEIKEQGVGICPVCHTAFHAGEPHDFAVLQEGTPSEEQVREAKAQWDTCEGDRTAQAAAVETLRETLRLRRASLLEKAKELLPVCGTWEQLSDAAFLSDSRAQLQRVKAQTEERWQEAKGRAQRQTELKQLQSELAEAAASLEEQITRDREALHQADLSIAGLEKEVEALQRYLPFAALEEAKTRLLVLKREQDRLEYTLNELQTALEQARESLNKARGELTAKRDLLPLQQSEEAEEKAAFETALSENGFTSREDMARSLPPVDREKSEQWLNLQQKELQEYRNDCKHTDERIVELTEQTEGLRYTDLEELEQQMEEAGACYQQAERDCAAQNGLLENHRQVLQAVSAARAALQRTDSTWERLDRLAELAEGAKVEGGKLSFERYVMGSIFRQVLEMANRRLDVMSGGRYELVHQTGGGRKNAAAGLEIEVMDVTTGKQRPANSLSGGETFQVSLSLALGLSDVVQSRAGGIGLDTIFIDEGFGALDSGALDSAIAVLHQLTQGNRLVGIISHVDKLEESIPQKLRVKKTACGSELIPELS